MPTCSSGSEPKPATPGWFTFTESDLAGFLAPIFGFVTYALMGIPSGPQNSADFCATEPTGDLPDAPDYVKLAIPPLALISGTYQRFGNQIKQAKFADICQCSAPPGFCTSTSCAFSHPGTDFSNGVCALGTNCSYLLHGVCGGLWSASSVRTIQFPSGQHRTRITVGTDASFSGTLEGYTATQGETTICSFSSGVGCNATQNWPTGDADLQLVWRNNTGTGGGSATITVEFENAPGESDCSSSSPFPPPPDLDPPTDFPPPITPPTCGSEQDICDTLQVILNQLNVMDALLNAIQRRLMPLNYQLGTPLTGLTGHNTVAASDILGVVVLLTTVPTRWGYTSATPRRLIPQVGDIQWETVDGYSDQFGLHYDQQIVLFGSPISTSWAYSLQEGIVATITPIIATP
jgi:hypothetical protein